MEQFDFFQQWYPVALLEDLDPNRPTPITIFGRRLVIWKPRQQTQYAIFLDQCPHRLAPLSEGRIDEQSDRLMCSYHGWEFDHEGHCQKIPQANQPDLLAKQGKNFCATSLPTQQKQDLLWVWLDETTADLAREKPLPLSSNLDTAKGFVWSSYAREAAYDWLTLVENIVDPSHVPFAHHGLQGKREQVQPFSFSITTSTLDLIDAQITSGFQTQITFKPPCLVEYKIPLGKNKQVGLVTYCVPVSPGKSRLIVLFPRNFAIAIGKLIPRWWEHMRLRNRVIDSDMIILQHQEYFNQQQSKPWDQSYKMPTEADRFVIEFRRWFDRYAAGQLPWEKVGITPEKITANDHRQTLLDRYHQHTLHCASCRQALKRIQWIKRVLIILTFCTIAITALLPDALRGQWGLDSIGLGVISGAIAALLHYKLEPEFYFVDYRHPDHP